MEVKGKVIIALPEVSGTSKAGNAWKKREYVLETQETYPRKVHFTLFGDRADQYPLNVGEDVTVSFDIESREFNGRWYTDIRAWKVEKGTGAAAMPPAAAPYGAAPAPAAPYGSAPAAPAMPGGYPMPPAAPSEPTDDLPF